MPWIAPELHDVIAHLVSAMVVQTAAARDLVQTDPERAGGVLAEVACTGRRALAETGRLPHVIRDDAGGELGSQLAQRTGQQASSTTSRKAPNSGRKVPPFDEFRARRGQAQGASRRVRLRLRHRYFRRRGRL
jgi:signal transduction histidine kinase